MTTGSHHARLIILAAISFLLTFSAISHAQTATYTYDELNHLIQVEYENGAVVQYSYDGVGNRLAVPLQALPTDTTPPTTTASPLGWYYNASQSVVLTCDDGFGGSGCDRIYYTTNGITPTTSSAIYSYPISVTVTTTLKFFANDRNGNSESVKSQTYTIDKTAPTGSVRINSGATITNSPNVTFTVTCSDASGCFQMQFSNDCGNWSAPESYATTKAWTLTTGDGGKFPCAKLRDTAGNWSAAFATPAIILDTTPPTVSMTINSGALATNNATVTLNLTCSDNYSCYYKSVSNDGISFTTSRLLTYPYTLSWALTPGDGNKTVYFKFMDTAGNWSALQNRTILLDTVLPATTASPSGGIYTTAQTVTLTCDDGTGSGCGNIYYTTNGSTPTTSSSVYSSPLNVTATTTLKYFAKDAAGNSETVKTQVYTIGGP